MTPEEPDGTVFCTVWQRCPRGPICQKKLFSGWFRMCPMLDRLQVEPPALVPTAPSAPAPVGPSGTGQLPPELAAIRLPWPPRPVVEWGPELDGSHTPFIRLQDGRCCRLLPDQLEACRRAGMPIGRP